MEYFYLYYFVWLVMVWMRIICKYIVFRFRNSFICIQENNFLYFLKLCYGEKGMIIYVCSILVIYNLQMLGVKMVDDLYVSMLIVYQINKCCIVMRCDIKK